MLVKEIMNARPVTFRPDVPVRAAVRLLVDHGVTALPVVDERQRVVGVISEADVIARDCATDPVSTAMSHVVVLAHPETDVAELRRAMTRKLVKSLPVVDAADRVVGVVSRSDIVRAMGTDDELLEQDVADLLAAARVPGCGIQVHNGVVDLTGIDPSDRRLPELLAAVAAVPGVVATRTW